MKLLSRSLHTHTLWFKTIWKDTSINAIILRQVSRLKPSLVFISLSVEKEKLAVSDHRMTRTPMSIPVFAAHSRLARTFLKTVLSSLAQICMSWWREEARVYYVISAHVLISSSIFLVLAGTHLTSNLLVNGTELFFLLGLLRFEHFSLKNRKIVLLFVKFTS